MKPKDAVYLFQGFVGLIFLKCFFSCGVFSEK